MGDRKWVVFALACIINIIGVAFTFMALPPLLIPISQEWNLSHTAQGILLASIPAAIAVFSIPAGIFSDRFGIRTGIGIGTFLAGAFGILRGFSPDFHFLLFCFFFIGVGIAFIVPNLPKLVGILFSPREFGITNGILLAGVGGGNACIVALIGLWMYQATGWRGCFILIGGATLCTLLLWMAGTSGIPGVERREYRLGKILSQREMHFLLSIEFCALGVFICFLGFLPQFLHSLKGMSMESASSITAICMGSAIFSNVLLPAVSDRIGRRKPFMIFFPLASGFFIYFLFLSHDFLLVSVAVLIGIAVGAYMPLIFVFPLEMREIGAELAGTATGLLFCGGNIGAIFIPVLSGYLIDTFSFHEAILFLAIIAGLPGIFASLMRAG